MSQPDPLSPSASTTPNPVTIVVAEGSEPDRGGAGIDRKSEDFMDGLSAMFTGFCMIVGWFWNGGRRLLSSGIALLRADTRNAGLAVMAIALLVVGVMAYNGHDSKAPQPPQPETATQQTPAGNGARKHKVKVGEHLTSIGEPYKVSRSQMIEANLDVIRKNTAWCLERPVSTDYLKGNLKGTSAKRDGSFCVMSDHNGETLAVNSLKVGQIVDIPVPQVANNEN